MNDRFKLRCWVEDILYDYSSNFSKSYEFATYVYFDMFTVEKESIETDIYEKINCSKQLLIDFLIEGIFKKKIYNKFEQCTGGKDKNGKLVYEGDILEGGEYRYVIKWSDIGYEFYGYTNKYERLSLNAYFMENSVIIGNIHENPELLNGGRNE